MTLQEATAESNGCFVVSDTESGGPVLLAPAFQHVYVGDRLVRVGDNNCVGVKRNVVKTFVVGPAGSIVELEFLRGQGFIVVQLKRFALPKRDADPAQLATFPPPGSAHANEWHKHPCSLEVAIGTEDSEAQCCSIRSAAPSSDLDVVGDGGGEGGQCPWAPRNCEGCRQSPKHDQNPKPYREPDSRDATSC
jgi:hypothetical protein